MSRGPHDPPGRVPDRLERNGLPGEPPPSAELPGSPTPVDSAAKLGFHPASRGAWHDRGRPVDVYAASTDVLPPDLTAHAAFPAQPAFQTKPLDKEILFRHSGWRRDRRRVFDALRWVNAKPSRIQRFRDCGSNAWVVRNEEHPDQYAIAADHCRDRFCRPCARFRGQTIANNVANYLQNREYRFLTVTIKTTDLSLKEGVDKLYRCFALLRRSKLWMDKVLGGCAVCEVKPKDGGVGWHPHLHAIIEGKYLPLKPLRKLWLAITGDSFIIDVAYGKNPDAAARYLSKYITKPFDDGTTRTPHRLHEAIIALTGRRLATTFGCWRGLRLTHYVPTGTWVKVCGLTQLMAWARTGRPDAVALLQWLIDETPYTEIPRKPARAPPEFEKPTTYPVTATSD